MKKNNHLGGDVLAYLDETVPDSPEARRVARQDAFRIALADAMRRVRARVGRTQKELARELGMGQSWISKLESPNNDHTFESVLDYLGGLGADLQARILLEGQTVALVTADPDHELTQASAETAETRPALAQSPVGIAAAHMAVQRHMAGIPVTVPPERRAAYSAIQARVRAGSMWGSVA